jgi:heptosyltransferase-1
MGDVIHGLPAAAALRAWFPGIELGWVIERRWADLLGSATPAINGEAPATARSARQPLVDRIHLADTFTWRKHPLAPETRREFSRLLGNLRRLHYDAAVDLQGSWKSAVLAGLSGARLKLGFRSPREAGAGIFYNRKIAAAGRHVIEQNLSLAAGLARSLPVDPGLIAQTMAAPPRVVLPERAEDERWVTAELAHHDLAGRPLAVINPGAGWGAKCWPAERFGQVARALAEWGLSSLINFGPNEQALAQTVEQTAAGAASPVSCTIGQLIALLRRAGLFVGGDTGPLHLAAALGVPVVALFGPTDPARNGPFAAPAVILRHASSLTDHARRAATEAGLLAIGVDEVVAAARHLLEGGNGIGQGGMVV